MIQTSCILYILLLIPFTGVTGSSIFGGKVSKPHSRPYMASLQYNRHHTCGGVLIRADFVLTAAHCKGNGIMTVVLGAHNISKEEKSQQRIEVAKYYQHPNFTGKYDWDIMLLKLKKKANLNKFVKTIGLPRKNGKTPANISCAVAGWGQIEAKKRSSDVLKEAREKMQFSFECRTIWREYFSAQRMICTMFDKKKGGVCQGDSGGPLVCNNKLEGITAYSLKEDCSDPKYPHVFTKVNYFIPWIKEVMQNSGNVV